MSGYPTTLNVWAEDAGTSSVRYAPTTGDGTHYTRTDTLPRWRTVAVDGMPEEDDHFAVDRGEGVQPMWAEDDVGFHGIDAWVDQQGGTWEADPTDRYIPLSELTRLPGGEHDA